ncbi:hypothetical protein [Streptosporangium sp. KLBMP 9127]|nr:hypothetical protein [Streptosporangium sp. KLBMP 9127]
MSLQLPGWAAPLLEDLGYWWTNADESKLGQAGAMVVDAEPLLDAVRDLGRVAATEVWNGNAGDGINAFQTAWNADDAPDVVLSDATTGMLAVGAGLFISGAIVLALKIHVVVQLASLATAMIRAIAAAGLTLGSSLLQIPVFKEITGRLIGLLIALAAIPLTD